MKFKSVEISAFRIYDDPKDAKFDFTLSNNEVADFVSLYAPNGFGKTSFYDAVEWGITNNIYRFLLNRTTTTSINALKDQQKEAQKEQVKLWRNRFSKKGRKTFVKITSENGEVTERDLNVHGNKTSDWNNSDHAENENFRQVILSQEWISAFLKEMDGNARYKIFMKNPQLQSIETYYRSTKELLAVCIDKINSLHGQISKEQEKLVELGSGDILALVNDQITLLNITYNQTLPLLTLTTTKEEIFKFQARITDNRISQGNSSNLETKKQNIDHAINGKINELISSAVYHDRLKSIVQRNSDLEKLNDVLKKFKSLDSNSNQHAAKNKLSESLAVDKGKLEDIKQKFAAFAESNKAISEKEKTKKEVSTEFQRLVDNKGTTERALALLKAEIDGFLLQIENEKKKLETIPGITKRQGEIDKEIGTLNSSQEQDKKSEDQSLIKQNSNKTLLSTLQENLDSIENEKFIFTIAEDIERFRETISEIRTLRNDIGETSQQLKELLATIKSQETLNSELQNFIAEGLRIVNATKSSTCPLCEQDFETYEKLAEKVSGNKAISHALQLSYGIRTTLENSIEEKQKRILEKKNAMKSHFSGKIAIENEQKSTIEKEIGVVRRSLGITTERLRQLNDEKTKLLLPLAGKSIEEFRQGIELLIKSIDEKRKESEAKQSSNQRTFNQLEIDINNKQANLIILDKEIGFLKENAEYKIVVEWFTRNQPDSLPTVEYIEGELQKLNRDIEINNEDIKKSKAAVDDLTKELEKVTLNGETERKKILTDQIGRVKIEIDTYESFVKNITTEKIPATDKELKELLNRLKSECDEQIKKRQQIEKEYQKLEGLCTNISPFLQSELAKKEIARIDDEINFLELKVKPILQAEKEKITTYLEGRVKAFFYADLINAIYNRIDPHPDFKSVLFKPDFDSDNPRLDVFVVNEKDEQDLIPNLYFSTAQINILSLSIFLASALNNDQYDCIFIDDPIQSMDSINILSTIDLLRSIIQTGKKQIILSTHDENFHKLLSKKMPPEFFKSKFLSLETFGKVTVEQVPVIINREN